MAARSASVPVLIASDATTHARATRAASTRIAMDNEEPLTKKERDMQYLIERTRPLGMYHPLEILAEWMRGCSNTNICQPHTHPGHCTECTEPMVAALRRSIIALAEKSSNDRHTGITSLKEKGQFTVIAGVEILVRTRDPHQIKLVKDWLVDAQKAMKARPSNQDCRDAASAARSGRPGGSYPDVLRSPGQS